MITLRPYAYIAGLAMFATVNMNASESEAAVAAEDAYEVSTEYVPVPERAIVLSGGINGVHRDVMNVLYDTSDTHFQDASVPRFLLIDRMGNTLFGIGGYVEGVFQYDFDGALDEAGFVTHDIPVPSNPAQRNRLAADATHTNIVLQLLRKTSLGVLSAYVQGNFSNADYGFKLKQAYVRLHNVTAGYTRSTFEDAIAGAPTIDYQGPSGAVSATNLIIQYKLQFAKNFTAAISAEIPEADYTLTAGANEGISQRCPDIPAYIQYQWDGGNSHVRASAIFRELSYRNLAESKNRFTTGWGVQLSGAIKMSDMFELDYEAVYGKGIANYINDLSGFGYDLISDGTDGKMKAPGSLGIAGGLRVNLTDKLFVSSTYSFCRLYDQENMGGDAYRRGNYAAVNCFYTPFSDFQVGVEYLHGRRTDMDHSHGIANRLEAMVKYSF